MTSAEMRAAYRWLLWQGAQGVRGKTRAVPHYVTGRPRSPATDTRDDVCQLGTLSEAETHGGDYAGIGFALGPDGLGGYWQGLTLPARLRLPVLPGYIERSPCGGRLHVFGYGEQFPELPPNGTGIIAQCANGFLPVSGFTVSAGPVACLANTVRDVLAPLHAGVWHDF